MESERRKRRVRQQSSYVKISPQNWKWSWRPKWDTSNSQPTITVTKVDQYEGCGPGTISFNNIF